MIMMTVKLDKDGKPIPKWRTGEWSPSDISPSKLALWKDCPRKYFYNYVRKLPRPDREFFVTGSVFDEVAFEEFRFDTSQDAMTIVNLAGDIIRDKLNELKEKGTLENFNGSIMSDSDIENCVSNFRIWTKSFLVAWQNGEDHLGNPVVIPPIADTQVQCLWPIKIDGQEVRINGWADVVHTDGSITDLKTASFWHSSRWTYGKVLSELQWIAYSQAMNQNKFRYIVVDKIKNYGKAEPATVRTFDVEVYPNDVERFKDLVASFLRCTDFLNGYKEGVFPPMPEYKGNSSSFGTPPSKKKFNEYDLTQNNFCRKLCDYKETCFKDCFGGSFRNMHDPRDDE